MARNKRLDPQKLAHERFDRYVPEDLTIKEASRLIDELRDSLSDRNLICRKKGHRTGGPVRGLF
jgi:hypothetical protein